jgi:hypothetical protein
MIGISIGNRMAESSSSECAYAERTATFAHSHGQTGRRGDKKESNVRPHMREHRREHASAVHRDSEEIISISMEQSDKES